MTDLRAAVGGSRWARPLAGIVVTVALLQGGAAVAQGADGSPPPAAAADPGVIATSMRVLDDGWAGLKDGAAAAWDTAAAVFLPAVPSGHLPERQSERTRAFFGLMELAGYRLAKIETGGMILSHVRYEFEQERRLTADDAERVRRAIARHEAQQTGLAAAYHRWIARSVLDAALSDEFRVAAVQVTMRPVPALEFRTVAVDRPLDDTERRLVQELRPAGNGGAR